MRNDGAMPDLPASAVVEVPARIDRDGAHPLPLAPLAPEQRGLVQAVKAYEELTVAAARTGDRTLAVRALARTRSSGRRSPARCSRPSSRRTARTWTGSPRSEADVRRVTLVQRRGGAS